MKVKGLSKDRAHREHLRWRLSRELPEEKEELASCTTFASLEHQKEVADSIKHSVKRGRPHLPPVHDLPPESIPEEAFLT